MAPAPDLLPSLRNPALRPGERIAVGLVSGIQGGIWAWGAWVLPFQHNTLLCVLAAGLGLANLVTSVSCVVLPAYAARSWRATSYLACATLGLCAWSFLCSGFYLSALYGQLGRGFGAALLAVLGLVALITLPLACWGLGRTPCFTWLSSFTHRRFSNTTWLCSVALGSALFTLGAALPSYRSAAKAALALPSNLDAELQQLLPLLAAQPRAEPDTRLDAEQRAECDHAPRAKEATLLMAYLDGTSTPQHRCIQAPSWSAAFEQVQRTLRSSRRNALSLELVTHIATLEHVPTGVNALSLRPGLDGACLANHCLAPWQLVARGAFGTVAPIEFLPDLRFGVAHTQLKKWLRGKDSEAAYRRIETQSFAISPTQGVVPLRRLLTPARAPTRNEVELAAERFQSFVVAALRRDGHFRYTLDPFTGKSDNRSVNLTRQAGTLYALCDVGTQTPEVIHTVRSGLQYLAKHAQPVPDTLMSGIALPEETELRLGVSALTLAALLRCRQRLGSEFDPLIQQLTRLLLTLQTPQGNFAPAYDLPTKKPLLSSQALYAEGQAVLALVLLEAEARRTPELVPSELSTEGVGLHQALEQSMRYASHEYWDFPLKDFFFLEENWHCLAAQTALPFHRNAAYEQFCLDYVSFKSRLILDASSGVAEEFQGGFGFGNIIPPHAAGAAGFAEALAAAVHLEHAQGQVPARDEALLRLQLGYILRHQWTEANCFACDESALGGFPEQVQTPLIRIDYAQHAWSALAHAQQELPW